MNKNKEVEIDENDMMKKLKELFDGESTDAILEEPVKPQSPLEEALEHALYSLNEIHIYAGYGRTAECAREAEAALSALNTLKTKWAEQTQVMDALTRPANNETYDE